MIAVLENRRVVGMLTDRDITVQTVADDTDPRQADVRDAMSARFITVFDEQSGDDVVAPMQKYAFRR